MGIEWAFNAVSKPIERGRLIFQEGWTLQRLTPLECNLPCLYEVGDMRCDRSHDAPGNEERGNKKRKQTDLNPRPD